MTLPDLYLLCFALGALWAFASLLLGGFHMGHAGHSGHVHVAHAVHGQSAAHAPAKFVKGVSSKGFAGRMAALVNPTSISVFLAWFGGAGYILTRHSGLMLWIDLAIAIALGLVGAWIVASFLQFLQSRETPLDPFDYDMVGVLGQVSCRIRPDGFGEVIYVREGVRRAVPARSEEGTAIERGNEVIVTRFEKGIAYVRTWEAMTQ